MCGASEKPGAKNTSSEKGWGKREREEPHITYCTHSFLAYMLHCTVRMFKHIDTTDKGMECVK